MASIINSIAFKNFYNYYGDYENTRYDFEKGINIVVADNGGGKSKFFNAFLWLFYDEVLDSDDKLKKNVKDIAYKIISDKAKHEISIQDYVECGIEIIYSTGLWKYRIIKSFTATKLNHDVSKPEAWLINLNDIEISKTDHILPKFSPIYDEVEKLKIIDQLIVPNLRQYSFLQGEEVDSIIDFSKRESIKVAVNTLTDMTKYETISDVLKDLKKRAEIDLNKQKSSSTAQSDRLKDATETKNDHEKSLEQYIKQLKEYENTYEVAEQEKNNLEAHFSNAEKRKELDDKIKEKTKKIQQFSEDYTSYLDSINNRFFDGSSAWISKGFENVSKVFSDKISEFREEHFKKKVLKDIKDGAEENFFFLPIGSPDAVSLDKMLTDEICYVCGRDAKKDSDAHNHILKLADRPKQNKLNQNYVKNPLDTFFDEIQIQAQPFYNKIDQIDVSVLKTREKAQELSERINRGTSELEKLKSQRKDILITGNKDSDARTIINSYRGAVQRMESSMNQIERFKDKISNTTFKIKNLEEEIKSLRPKDIAEGYLSNYEILSDLHSASELAKTRVFDNMIEKLESYANEHFKALIKYNDLSGGILKFTKSPTEAINLEYIDSDGNIVHGASEGFQRMKKFSVVMAIISANTQRYNYPLLADAPLSAFGEGFTEGFFEATSEVFPQSIVLVKEFYKADDDQKLTEIAKKILKEKHVKSFYVNIVPENAEQKDIVTTKFKLK
ncbi:AAA family ATPase [Myroides odoratimimus]|uniref:AAA family ATPase n=1 Tax=Myroides odoratimimus TaxID=76832 RepID=UPI002574ABF6|nr:AAA family ATPase [Myroides odoratimimus]MDM1530755.1 AAA family ATPase [Myroides odoratimimus]